MTLATNCTAVQPTAPPSSSSASNCPDPLTTSQAISHPGAAPRLPQALRSLSIRVTQIAAKGTIRPRPMEIMNKAPNWL